MIGAIIGMAMLSGCGKEKEITDSFEKTLSVYPTPNLEDWYDREGYRDDNFDKNDKGMWILSSDMAIPKGSDLVSEGLVLKFNRNTKKAEGYFYIRKHYVKDDVPGTKEEKYLVKMEKNKIIPTQDIQDEKLKRKIENFKFFSQYGNFKKLSEYNKETSSYNPNVPSYSIEYQLTNEDDNVKKIRKRYPIPTDNAPKLELKGTGDLKGSSVGYRQLEYQFKIGGKRVLYSDAISYQPTERGLE